LHAVVVDEAGYFDGATVRQVVDQVVIEHVAVDDARRSGLDGVDDRRAVFDRSFKAAQAVDHLRRVFDRAGHDLDFGLVDFIKQRDRVLRAGVAQFAFDIGPGLFEDLAAARVLVERDVELGEQVFPASLDEPRHILGEVLARLGGEIPESAEHFVAHAVPVRYAAIGHDLRELRIEGFALMVEA